MPRAGNVELNDPLGAARPASRSPAACTASKSPLMTICVGELKFASCTRFAGRGARLSTMSRTTLASRPRTADIPPPACSAAICIAFPRSSTTRKRFVEIQRPRDHQTAELAERMARADDRIERIADGAIEREIRHENRRLAELRLAQLLFRPVDLQREQIVPEHLARAREERARSGERAATSAAHADAFASPGPGNDDADPHHAAHRQATAPHESPPPKADEDDQSPG